MGLRIYFKRCPVGRPRKADSELRHGRRCVFALHVHMVFVTKYRCNVFKREHLEAMLRILADVCRAFEAELVEFNGEHDHVHLRVSYPSKVAL
jgi:putative transposase